MEISFVRHGEAMDDVEDRYGGWADYPLSPKGQKQVLERAQELQADGVSAAVVISSPFKRARQTADQIASILSLKVEENVYLKERNTYGLLCGVTKQEAKKKYPRLWEAYENDQPVLGYEEYQFFLKRVRKLVEILPSLGYKKVICVTHGKLLKALVNDVAGGFKGKKAVKFGDVCLVEVEIRQGKARVIAAAGVEFE